jgi:translation initiation factor IF-3
MKPPPNQPPNAANAASKGPQLLTDKIKASEVRLVSEEEQFGIVTRQEAERMAAELGLDLIVMSLDSSPPVVRMMDFGKYKFEKEKKAREAKKKQHTVDVKEIKMGVRIDKHDYEVKLGKSKEILEHGHKLKVTIRLRGREIQHPNLAFDLANKFVVDLEGHGNAEAPPKLEGRNISLLLTPDKKKPSP